MDEFNLEPEMNTRNLVKAKGNAFQVYMRLLRYAWNYKVRLVLSMVFAILVAGSFATIIVGTGTAVQLIMQTADPDPAIERAEQVGEVIGSFSRITGYSSEAAERDFLAMVEWMRAEQMTALVYICIVLILLALVGGIARYLQEFFAGAIGAHICVDVGEEMYANVLQMPIRFFEERSSGEILARFTNDIFMINRGLSSVLIKLLREPIKAIFFLAVALRVDPVLTLVGLCALPPVAYVIVRIGHKIKKSVRRSLEKIASMATVVNETIHGIAIVKGYSMEEYEARRLHGEVGKLRRFLMQMAHANAAVGPLSEFLLVIGIAAFVLVSGQRIVSGTLDAGQLVMLYFALAAMLDPVRKLSTVNNMIQTSIASAERVFELVDAESDILEADNPIDIPRLEEAIHFDRIHFSYDGKTEVLKGVDFEVKRGEMVALVGFSGGGKSTLAKLLPRFYDVTEGAIRFDGADIRAASFKSLRGQISIVPQETILFNTTVRDNIRFGRADFTEEQVIAAAKAAHAHDFIQKLPRGYDTVLGESGASLSGGQRQRLAIARALIKDPAVLVLDEATSSLDSESERAIQAALDEFVEGRTTIVIAHRLSTVRRADRIVVIDDGTIAEQGTHDYLLANGGIYQRLYEVQFASGEKAAQN